jgi:hypothetical protein
MSSDTDKNRLHWTHVFATQTLHEVTLPTLLGARNYAAIQLLSEHNQLLCERYSILV